MENFDTLVIQASDILDKVENYQFEIGKLCNEIIKNYGYKALTDFSKQIETNCGVKRSPGTLRMYGYIYSISTRYNIPKDLLFSTCQAIAFSDNPQKYIEMAKKGASRIDIRNQIWEDKHRD